MSPRSDNDRRDEKDSQHGAVKEWRCVKGNRFAQTVENQSRLVLTTDTSINAETVPPSEPGSHGSAAPTTSTDGKTTDSKQKNDKRKIRHDATGTSPWASPWKKEFMEKFDPTAPKPADGSHLVRWQFHFTPRVKKRQVQGTDTFFVRPHFVVLDSPFKTWWNEEGKHCSEFPHSKRFEMNVTTELDNDDFMECMTPLDVEEGKIGNQRVPVFASYVTEVLKLNEDEISDFRIQMKEACAKEWKEYLDKRKIFALTFRKWKEDNPDGEAKRKECAAQKRRKCRQKRQGRRGLGDMNSLLSTNTTNQQSMGSDEQMPDRVDSDLEGGSTIA